jgi:hypothetical protein
MYFPQHNTYRRNFFQQNKFIWNKKASPTSSWNAISQGEVGAGLFLFKSFSHGYFPA